MDYSRLKRQYISNVDDRGDYIIINTPNFKITVPKRNVEQTKQFEEYPKILEDKVFKFNGYEIYDRIVQESPKIKEFYAFVYFPKIDYSFGDENDLRKHHILTPVSPTQSAYGEIKEYEIGIRDFFKFLIIAIRKLDSVDENKLIQICHKYADHAYKKATYKPNDIYGQYRVYEITVGKAKQKVVGFRITENQTFYSFDLIRGKNF